MVAIEKSSRTPVIRIVRLKQQRNIIYTSMKSHSTDPLLPQYFYVPEEYMADERAEPTTQGRVASEVEMFYNSSVTI